MPEKHHRRGISIVVRLTLLSLGNFKVPGDPQFLYSFTFIIVYLFVYLVF